MTLREDPHDLVIDAVSILVRAGVMDFNGHASARLPGGGFCINSAASNRRAMTRDQVCEVDAAGVSVSGGRPPNEVALHAAIYAARSDVAAVIHGHPKWTTLFTASDTPIPVQTPQGALVADLPVFPDSRSVSTPDRGAAVAQALGQRRGILLRNHGCAFVGVDLIEAVALAIYAEQNAERVYMALPLGGAVPLSTSDAAEYGQSLAKSALYRKCWDFHLPDRE